MPQYELKRLELVSRSPAAIGLRTLLQSSSQSLDTGKAQKGKGDPGTMATFDLRLWNTSSLSNINKTAVLLIWIHWTIPLVYTGFFSSENLDWWNQHWSWFVFAVHLSCFFSSNCRWEFWVIFVDWSFGGVLAWLRGPKNRLQHFQHFNIDKWKSNVFCMQYNQLPNANASINCSIYSISKA